MSERDVMEYDVVAVGAGPAGLAFAIRLKQLKPELQRLRDREVLDHRRAHPVRRGDRARPARRAAARLARQRRRRSACRPRRTSSGSCRKTGGFKLPVVPPQMNNHGNFIVSLGAMCAWLAPQAEALGVEIYPGFAAAELLHDEAGAVVRRAHRRHGRGARRLAQARLHAGHRHPARSITVLAEGARGHLTKRLVEQVRARRTATIRRTIRSASRSCGRCRPGACRPARSCTTWAGRPTRKTYGGSFLYHLDERPHRARLRLRPRLPRSEVPALRSLPAVEEPSAHQVAARGRHHPVAPARARSSPAATRRCRRVEMPGAMLIGDAAGLLNVPKIKGTHQAIRSGMLAAEHIAATGARRRLGRAAARLAGDGRAAARCATSSPASRRAAWFGLLNSAWETVTDGHVAVDAGRRRPTGTRCRSWPRPRRPKRDYVERTLPPRDRLAGVYFAATEHDEDQPIHLRVLDTSICIGQCAEEYDNPCTRFCPAGVYEMVTDASGAAPADQRRQLRALQDLRHQGSRTRSSTG